MNSKTWKQIQEVLGDLSETDHEVFNENNTPEESALRDQTEREPL